MKTHNIQPSQKRYFKPALFSTLRSELFGFSIINVMIYHYASSFLADCGKGVLSVSPHSVPFLTMRVCHDFFCSIGVEIFLLLSGIGLFFAFVDNENLERFYKHRFLRILPEYLIVAFIYWWLCDMVFRDRGFANVLQDVFFVSFPAKGIVSLWYVIAILVFYAVYPFLYFLFRKSRHRLLLLILLLAVSMTLLALCNALHLSAYWNMRIGLLRIPVILIGVYLGPHVYRHVTDPGPKRPGWRLPAVWIFIIAAFAGRILVHAYHMKAIVWRTYDALFGLAMLLFVTIILSRLKESNRLRRFLRLCGKYSLELYMTHVCLRWIFESAGIHTGYPYIYLLILALSVAITPLLCRFGNLFKQIFGVTSSSFQPPDPTQTA